MNLTCPSCGAKSSLEAMTEDASARRVAALFGQMQPEIARVVPGYLALFLPEKTGLRWSRAETILSELLSMIREGYKRGGRRVRPSPSAWVQALQEVATRDLRRPLKSHGYLMEVASGLVTQHEAAQEQAHHDSLRQGKRPSRQVVDEPVSSIDNAVAAVLHRFECGYLTEDQRDAEIAEIRRGSGDG
jgi:hypothetical protein